LQSFVGLNLAEPIILMSGNVDTSLARLPELDVLADTALAGRPEMRAAVKLTQIAKKGITVAKADYWPHLDAVGAYSWSAASDDFTLDENTSESWTAGLSLSFNIFPLSQKSGAVNRARAQYNQTLLTRQQTRDDIILEVEEAYTQLLQAKKALDVQGSTIAAAEEGLRIAQVRYDSGVGTQLEVLSAQTALTEARQVEAQALYAFKVAKAELKRVTTYDW
jgi:outer membrane protein TolC